MARSAPPLTNLMYPDDLLSMGSTARQEMTTIHRILQEFCSISGQKISPEKSKLWFSNATPLGHIRKAIKLFRVQFASKDERYLESPINAAKPAAFNPLLDKIDAKMQGWKARFLSPTEKIILLKSVMEAVLIYQMSTTFMYKSVMDKIQSKFVQFFWGKPSKKAICFVRWEKLTRPKLEGGLGLWDIHMLNFAMVLKNTWKIVSNSDALWVQVLVAKYHPSTSFWHSNCLHTYTRLWSAIMQNRPILAANIKWFFGDDWTCQALA